MAGFLTGFLLVPPASAAAAPVLQKVFVYSGRDRIRLVALFDRKLSLSRPALRRREGAVALLLPKVGGGKPVRHFEVGQGGYTRLEAKESPEGLWLTVRAARGLRGPAEGADVATGESSLTLTLPRLGAGATVSGRAKPAPPKKAARGPSRRAPDLTAEGIINQVLSPASANAATVRPKDAPAKAPPAPKPAARRPPAPGESSPGKETALPRSAQASGAGFPNPGVGDGVQSITAFSLKVAAALGGMLALIFGGLLLLRRIAPSAAMRLGTGGRLVRTLHKAYLAPKQVIAVVEVAGEILVVGISGQNISMLTKLEDAATLARLREEGRFSFADHLSKLLANGEGETKEKAADEAPGTEARRPAGSRGPSPDQEKAASAILAYARQASGGAGGGRAASRAALAPRPSRRSPAGAALPTDRAAARLRERLSRMTPELTGSAAAS